MITKKDLDQALDQLELSQSDICLHTSMRSLGDSLERGLDGFAEVFLERGCTILVPTFSDMFLAEPAEKYMPRQNGAGDYSGFFRQDHREIPVFDTKSKLISKEKMGAFSAYVLQAGGSVRGNHPLNSFTALGPDAAELVRGQTPQDVYAPLRKLYENDGHVLLAGVSFNRATIIHYAEQLAGRRPFVRWARTAGGRTVPVAVGSCSKGFDRLGPLLEPFLKRVTVGQSIWICCRARDITDTCVQGIARDPQITHCGDRLCSRCNDAVLGGPDIDASFWTN